MQHDHIQLARNAKLNSGLAAVSTMKSEEFESGELMVLSVTSERNDAVGGAAVAVPVNAQQLVQCTGPDGATMQSAVFRVDGNDRQFKGLWPGSPLDSIKDKMLLYLWVSVDGVAEFGGC